MFGFLLIGYILASVAFYLIHASRAVRMDEVAMSAEIVMLFPESRSKAA